MKKIAIGIDFSKLSFDATLMYRNEDSFNVLGYSKFDNNLQGFKSFEKWVKVTLKGNPEAKNKSEWLFCGEHTGICSIGLCDYLTKRNYFMWLESPMVIKRKSGIIREKNDKVDSERIATFSLCNFNDKIKPYALDSENLKKLKSLYSSRSMLVNHKVAISNQLESGALDSSHLAKNEFKKLLSSLIKSIDKIDADIQELLKKSDEFKRNYEILDSFKGVGPVTIACLIIKTSNFNCMTDSRELGCYIGVVPHKCASGTSIDKAPRTSRYRDRNANGIITNCAMSAVRFNPVIKKYYKRLIERGVDWHKAMNNCKFKIINILLAMIKSDSEFDMEKYAKSKKEWKAA